MLAVCTITTTFILVALIFARFIIWKNKPWRIPRWVYKSTKITLVCFSLLWVVNVLNTMSIASSGTYG